MTSRERTVPPGQGRIAAAARAGLFPRSGAIPSGLGFLATACILTLFGEEAGQLLIGLLTDGLDVALWLRLSPVDALSKALGASVGLVLLLTIPLFLGAFLGAVVPAVVAKRRRGRTAVPLPRPPKIRLVLGVIQMAGLSLIVLLALYIFRGHFGAVWRLLGGELGAALILFQAFVKLLAAGGFVMLLVGGIELVISRQAIWKSLFLDRLEARREDRAGGLSSPITAQQRRRSRKEVKG